MNIYAPIPMTETEEELAREAENRAGKKVICCIFVAALSAMFYAILALNLGWL